MTHGPSLLRGIDDPRLAVHATTALPAWLWSTDGSRVLWANPVATNLFGAAHSTELIGRRFGAADPRRRLVAQLAKQLPESGTVRLQRLRFFGARLGGLVTCGCSRLAFEDGSSAILIAAAELVGRPMPLIERLRGLVDGLDVPAAAFARDGLFIGSSAAARTLNGFRNLTEAGLDQARADALTNGRSETPIGIGHVVLQRVGVGAEIGLIALLEPGAVDRQSAGEPPPSTAPDEQHVAAAQQPTEHAQQETASDEEAIASTSEAPAEYSLLEEIATNSERPPQQPETVQSDAQDLPVSAPDETLEAPADRPTDVADPEPSPLVEAVADEPPPAQADGPSEPETLDSNEPSPPAEADEAPLAAETKTEPDEFDAPPTKTEPDQPAEPEAEILEPRRHPLRFVWQIDAAGNFTIPSDEFNHLIGPAYAAQSGRPWRDYSAALALDPDARFAAAIETRRTFSGVTLYWPAESTTQRLPVEIGGLPVQDRDGGFTGYRGFGVIRDLEGLDRLALLRRRKPGEDAPAPQSLSANRTPPEAASALDAEGDLITAAIEAIEPQQPDPTVTTQNVLPFPAPDGRSPSLTPGENNAFNELARQLSARLDNDAAATIGDAPERIDETAPTADWLAPQTAPAKADSARDRVVLDLVPVGILIYRLDRLVYANAAFLTRVGYDSLAALEQAGGLDALYVGPGTTETSSASDDGAPISISAVPFDQPHSTTFEGRLHTIEWDGEQAVALIFDGAEAASAEPATAPEAIEAKASSEPGGVNAEELGAILDTTAEGILMFDAAGRITACNRSAEALFGYAGEELTASSLIDLFAPKSQRQVMDYLDSVKSDAAESVLDHGLEALGRVRDGGLFPLTMTIGRTQAGGPNFFAVFRDLSQARKVETELAQVRRAADRAFGAKADVLARISHEVRTPLNAIIGFAEVMIEERFGTLGNERYVEYMKDIRASGEKVVGIINDLLDLTRIETGKLDLAFASHNLNDLVEQCVAVMQPRANRERIIIRSSLSHALPPVVADIQSLRQIVMNLVGTSIQLANAGGQVIVSTALTDFGEVALRVRDTGSRLADTELAAALQPFRTPPPGDHTEAAAVSLSLTKALVEANRAKFAIKSAPQSGTLIEVVFSHTPVKV